MAARKRKSRADEMEQALFAALDTPVPPKDVGIDPKAVLGYMAEKAGRGGEAGGRAAQDETAQDELWAELGAGAEEAAERVVIELSPAGQKHLDAMANMASEILGREISRPEALKIMLEAYPVDHEFVKKACLDKIEAKTTDKGND